MLTAMNPSVPLTRFIHNNTVLRSRHRQKYYQFSFRNPTLAVKGNKNRCWREFCCKEGNCRYVSERGRGGIIVMVKCVKRQKFRRVLLCGVYVIVIYEDISVLESRE
jgi:hypothetical protein